MKNKNKNKNKKTQLRTTRKPNQELFVVVATRKVGGDGGEPDGARRIRRNMDGGRTYMMSTTCLYVFLLTRTLDSTLLACSESVFSIEL